MDKTRNIFAWNDAITDMQHTASQSALIRSYAPAIDLFEAKKAEYDQWYMKRPSVSIAMMLEREELFKRYDFAIKTLLEASGA